MKLRGSAIKLLFLLFPVFFVQCTDEGGYIPGLTGNMAGFVYTFDEFGNLLNEHSNVKTTAIGIEGQYSTLTDDKGRFEIKGVPTGTYEMHFEKEGFGLLKQFGVQHLGGKPTILNNYFIFEMPATKITNLTIVNDTIYGEFAFTVQEHPSSILLRIYFSTEDDFGIDSVQYVTSQYLWDWEHNDMYKHRIYFEDAPFTPGEEVFFRACIFTQRSIIYPPWLDGRSIYGIYYYYDYEYDVTVYPNLSDESAQYSFIFPE